MAEVIGILSLKGGVGKTSSTISLGKAISKFGKKVLVIDGNLSSPCIGIHLNVIHKDNHLHNVLANKISPTDAIVEREDFDLIISDLFSRTKVNPLKLKDKIRYLKRKYDFIIIDSSPALNEETLGVMIASDKLIIVTTPDAPTLGTTIKAVKDAKQRGVQISGIILNKVYNKDFEIDINDIEELIEVPVVAVIPHDPHFVKATSEFKPYVSINPKSEASEEFFKLAAAITGEKYRTFRLKDLFRKVSPKKQDINRVVFYESIFE